MKGFKIWFWAATIYNFTWGVIVSIWPDLPFRVAGMEPLNHQAIMQSVAMMVGVYALGYYYLARDPIRYANFIWIGLLGKTLGPAGFLVGYLSGTLPAGFFWVILTNDLIWWPSFWMFALRHARDPLAKKL